MTSGAPDPRWIREALKKAQEEREAKERQKKEKSQVKEEEGREKASRPSN
jgi:hypothetical protein